MVLRRIGSANGNTKLKYEELESWSNVELIALGRRIMEILADRRLKEAARAASMANLLNGKEKKDHD